MRRIKPGILSIEAFVNGWQIFLQCETFALKWELLRFRRNPIDNLLRATTMQAKSEGKPFNLIETFNFKAQIG